MIKSSLHAAESGSAACKELLIMRTVASGLWVTIRHAPYGMDFGVPGVASNVPC